MQDLLGKIFRKTVIPVMLILCWSLCVPAAGDETRFGQPIEITEKGGEYSNSGTFILTVDGVHICRGVSEYLTNGMKALGIQCVIENVNYRVWYDNSDVLEPYDVSEHVRVTDSDGFTCEFYNLDDSSGDGKYAIGAGVRKGDKVRNTLVYLVDPDMKEYKIRIGEYTYYCRLNDKGEGELIVEDELPASETDTPAASADTPEKSPAEAGKTSDEPAALAGDQSALQDRLESLEKKVLELEERLGTYEKTGSDLEGRVSALEAAGEAEDASEEPAVRSEETVRKYETALTGYYKLVNEIKATGDLIICDVVYYPPKNMVVFEYSTEKTYDDYVEYAAYMEGETKIDTYYAKSYYNKPVCEHLDWDDIMRYNETERG